MLAKKRGKEQSAKVNRRLHWLAHVGYASRSLLFLSIGILALLAAYDSHRQTVGGTGTLQVLAQSFGRPLLDLTWLFWTKRCERMAAVQRRAQRMASQLQRRLTFRNLPFCETNSLARTISCCLKIYVNNHIEC
jgi:hypothetical protein